MKRFSLYIMVVLFLSAACLPAPPTPTPTLTEFIKTITYPPVIGSDPSYRIAAFYYPWYRTPEVDSYWDHWGETAFHPPQDIASDYYPMLGAYSIADKAVLAQHFAWLREAGIGVIISSWWGQGSREDRAVPLLLEIAEEYGIKVAFHIEPYGGRTANRLLDDVKYIYDRYGGYQAFYRTTDTSRWSQDNRSKGLFFVWAIVVPDTESPPVEAEYWRDAVDAIHTLPDGGIVIANTTESDWVDRAHFDGLYNYITLDPDESGGFTWARGLPPDAWYVPSVIPGNSAKRIGYPPETYVPRKDGATYKEQWNTALGTSVEPTMVTITSFNEWHEGSQIEPAEVGATNGLGYTYTSYELLPPEGYLTLSRQLGERFLTADWPTAHRVRIRVATTSDWTTVALVSGAAWIRPSLVSASEEAIDAWLQDDHFILTQSIERAEAGGSVEMVVDILLTDMGEDALLEFHIDRGHLGATQVELSKFMGDELSVIDTFTWSGINPGEDNVNSYQVPIDQLANSSS